MKKYRKRSETIEALQWTGRNLNEVFKFTDNRAVKIRSFASDRDGNILLFDFQNISTGEVCRGDYILKDPLGLLFTLTAEDFENEYEEVKE